MAIGLTRKAQPNRGLSRLAQIRARVAETIECHHLLESEEPALVAFSGGADSTALAVLLVQLGYPIVLGHVDHEMRPESGAEAERCVAVASLLRVPIHVERVKVVPPGEAQARAARYPALERIAERAAAAKIATGHTLDDHLETILMRLGRGGRAFGIPVVRGAVVRPLIDLRRSDTEAVCSAAGLTFSSDPSNEDERFERNHIRRKVIPTLSDAGVLELLRLAEANRLAAALLDREVAQAGKAGRILVEEGTVRLDRRWLAGESEAMRRAVIRRAVEAVGKEPTSRLVADIDTKVLSTTGARLDLPGGQQIWSEPEHLVAGLPNPRPELPEVVISIPGVTIAQQWGLAVRTSLLDKRIPGPPTPPVTPDVEAGGGVGPLVAEVVVDANEIADPLVLRPRRPGDRFRPLGMEGTKKLQDFFVDSKIPRRERDRIPIIALGDRIVWVAGYRIDDGFKPTPQSRVVLSIQIFPVLQQEHGGI